jgi:hypothetical protein
MFGELGKIMEYEPQPTITILCEKQPVPGQPGTFQLVPRVSFTNMPGGWETCLQMLMQSVLLVHREMLHQAWTQGEQRIAVVPAMPNDLVRHEGV